jgi:hypothetical protein
MLIEPFVLGGQDCLAHDIRDFLDFDDGPPLFAELS